MARRARVSCAAFFDREALMETEAVLTEIQNHLSTPTPTLPQDTGEGVSAVSNA